ncbi:MAG: hypothetical protein ACK5PQ_02470 [Alphaproteobacteria bacterium]
MRFGGIISLIHVGSLVLGLGCLSSGFSALKNKPEASFLEMLVTPPGPSHQSTLEALWTTHIGPWHYTSGSVMSPVPFELEDRLTLPLMHLYGTYVQLLTQVHPHAETVPTPTPLQWVQHHFQNWKTAPFADAENDFDLDEGLGATLGLSPHEHFILQAQETLLDLIKDTDLLRQTLATRVVH